MAGNEKDDKVDGATVAASLIELLARWRRSIELDLRVAMPARVVAYEPMTQKAVVRLELLQIKFVQGEEVPAPPDVTPPVPVRWPRGMGGLAYDTIPLLPEDTGHVVFTDRSLSAWLTAPPATPSFPVDPINGRTHNLGDAFFEPGLHTDSDPITPPTALDARVIEAPLIRLGVGGVDFVIKGTTLSTALTPISATLAAVPPAADLATAVALANANKAAIIGTIAAIQANLSTKVQAQ